MRAEPALKQEASNDNNYSWSGPSVSAAGSRILPAKEVFPEGQQKVKVSIKRKGWGKTKKEQSGKSLDFIHVAYWVATMNPGFVF